MMWLHTGDTDDTRRVVFAAFGHGLLQNGLVSVVRPHQASAAGWVEAKSSNGCLRGSSAELRRLMFTALPQKEHHTVDSGTTIRSRPAKKCMQTVRAVPSFYDLEARVTRMAAVPQVSWVELV